MFDALYSTTLRTRRARMVHFSRMDWMTRILAALSAAAIVALPLAAMAQTPAPTPKTATVNNVEITSVSADPASLQNRIPESRESLLNKLSNSRPALPAPSLPPSADGSDK
jgi:hypothetical protein